MFFLHCSVQYIYCIDNVNIQEHFFDYFVKILLGIKIRPNPSFIVFAYFLHCVSERIMFS